MRSLLPLLLFSALLSACGESPSSATANKTSTVQAVDFSFPDLDGESRNLKEWRGKVVLLNFWASWCPPCRKEVPAFITLQEKYAEKGFTIVGITLDSQQNAEVFADTMGINYPVLIATEGGTLLAEKYGNKVGTLPYTAIIDRQGRVVSTHRSEMTLQATEKLLVELL
jgi:thiol-disulfide isomerase/thioredoxin